MRNLRRTSPKVHTTGSSDFTTSLSIPIPSRMHCRQRAHSVCRRLLFWLSPKNMKAFGNFSGRIFGTAMRLSETHRVSITNDSSDEDNLQEYQKRNRFSLSYVLHAYKRRCITSFFTKHETGKRWLDLTRDLKNALPRLPRPPRFFHWSS